MIFFIVKRISEPTDNIGIEMYYEALQMKDQLLSSLRVEDLSAFLLLGGTTFIVLLILWYLKKKSRKSFKHPIMVLSSVFFLIFLMPFFFVGFVVFYAPQHAITYPPDLLTVSIILGGIYLFYSITHLTKISARILRYEAGRRIINKQDSKQHTIVDPLTGLYNKTGFVTLTEHHMRLARRNKRKVLMMYVKIERLKQMHDTLGYQERDMVILETSKLLTSTFRAADIIARVSEDSFLIFLIGCPEDHACGVSSHFQEMHDAHNARLIQKFRVPIRYCVVDFYPEYNNEFHNILGRAEDLLLQKKNATMTNSASTVNSDKTGAGVGSVE
jgi:diguanylate cyclase (GGDEF)-like protein